MIMHEDTEHLDLTICSVYHSSEAKRLLELNYDVVKKMNPGVPIHWLVADNTPEGFTDTIDEHKFTVVPGAQGVRPVADWIVGSYRHSEAINSSLSHITTRFALFLDVDFYIIRKNWMKDVIRHMQDAHLAFFGAPWFPAHCIAIRYFPSHRALFVDLKQVPISKLDFRPCFDHMIHPTVLNRLVQKIKRIKSVVSRRMTIGTRQDTGFRIYRRFHRRTRFECLTPVFVPAMDLCDIPEARSVWEKILPDFLSYIPKKTGYYTERGFGLTGFPDARAQGWEEFMWRREPFGFHIRAGTFKMKNNAEETMAQLHRLLAGCYYWCKTDGVITI